MSVARKLPSENILLGNQIPAQSRQLAKKFRSGVCLFEKCDRAELDALVVPAEIKTAYELVHAAVGAEYFAHGFGEWHTLNEKHRAHIIKLSVDFLTQSDLPSPLPFKATEVDAVFADQIMRVYFGALTELFVNKTKNRVVAIAVQLCVRSAFMEREQDNQAKAA